MLYVYENLYISLYKYISAANQGDNTVSVLSLWLVADEDRVSHVLSHIV